MTLASADIRTLVKIVGRHGACAALSHSHKIRAQELFETADRLGISLPKRTSKAKMAVAIVRHVDRRVGRSLEELKQLSRSEILQYFNEVEPDTEEIVDILRSVDIDIRARSRKSLLEFAATQISSLGVFERLALHPSSSRNLSGPSRRKTWRSLAQPNLGRREDEQGDQHAEAKPETS